MASITLDYLATALEVAEQLRIGRDTMLEPQDLPGRFGRVIRALDRLLELIDSPAVVAGGWAVWSHGYVGRVTQDVDVVIPADRIEELIRVAAVSGFDVLPTRRGMWPKLHHKDTDIDVDILPEGATPGTPSRLAPTTIPHPTQLGGSQSRLTYVGLSGLIELKLAAGRARDDSDIVELVRANPGRVDAIRIHLATVHPHYVSKFDELVIRAREEGGE